jgi:predicted transcriptional regulator
MSEETLRNLDAMIRFRVDEDLKKRVERLATFRGCDASDIGREAVLSFLRTEESRLGLVEEGAQR